MTYWYSKIFFPSLFQLSSNYSCLIWTTSPTKAKYLKDLQDDNFVDAVNDAFVSLFEYTGTCQTRAKKQTSLGKSN